MSCPSPNIPTTYLLLILLPDLEHLLVGEADAVHALEAVVVGVAEPVGRRVPRGGEGLDLCLLYTSPSPRDGLLSRMPSSA